MHREPIAGRTVVRARAAVNAALLIATVIGGLALTCVRADAASMEAVSTKREAGRYSVTLRAHLDVAPLAAYAVFVNTANWERLTPDLRQVEVLDQHRDGAMELSTAFQACLLWYCGTIHAVPDVFLAPRPDGGDIYFVVRPGFGDLRAGQAHWRLRASGSGTDLEFAAEVAPAFFVPPVIGPWLVARWLRGEALKTATNVEALARSEAAGGARASRHDGRVQ